MATTGFRQKMTTIYRSSADRPFACRSLDRASDGKTSLLATVVFCGLVVALLALRVAILAPGVGP
jgi:hypothetical protein